MISKKLILITILIIQSIEGFSQNNSALIWRGFSHSWTYNHRVNRLGDFVTMQDGKPKVCHAAASGIGADSCFFTSNYSMVESQNVTFQEGYVSIKLYGKEKQLISKTVEISIPAAEGMQGQDHYISLLNGFDILALGKSDKLQLLRFSIEDAYYAPAVNELRFLVNVGIVVDCQSLECSCFSQKSTYELKIYYLIAAGDHNNVIGSTKTVTENYPWDKKIESAKETKQQIMIGHRESVMQSSALGIKSLSVTLDQAHWLLQYNSSVTPIDYNPQNAKAIFSFDLFFQEWQQGMKTMSAMPKHSKFSFKKDGWSILDMELVFLQFKEAKVKHEKYSDSFFWKGKNTSPDVPEALKTKELNFDK